MSLASLCTFIVNSYPLTQVLTRPNSPRTVLVYTCYLGVITSFPFHSQLSKFGHSLLIQMDWVEALKRNSTLKPALPLGIREVVSQKDVIVTTLLTASGLKSALARKKRIGLCGWIVGGGEWAGFGHAWNQVLRQYCYVCLSLFLSLSPSLQLSTFVDFVFKAGSFTWWASWPLVPLDSRPPILAALAERRTSVSHSTYPYKPGEDSHSLCLGHVLIPDPNVMA